MVSKPSKSKSTRRRIVWSLVVFVAIVAIALLSMKVWDYGRNHYYWGVSDSIQSLLDDPITSATFDGLKLVDTQTTDHVNPIGMSKPRPPYVYLWYSVDGISPEEALRRVVEDAQSNGWSGVPDRGNDDKTWVGTKDVPGRSWGNDVIVTNDSRWGNMSDKPSGGELVIRLIPGSGGTQTFDDYYREPSSGVDIISPSLPE